MKCSHIDEKTGRPCTRSFKSQETFNAHMLFRHKFLNPVCSTGLAMKKFNSEQEARQTIKQLKRDIQYKVRDAQMVIDKQRGVYMFVEIVEEYNKLFDEYLIITNQYSYLKNLPSPLFWEDLLYRYYYLRYDIVEDAYKQLIKRMEEGKINKDKIDERIMLEMQQCNFNNPLSESSWMLETNK